MTGPIGLFRAATDDITGPDSAMDPSAARMARLVARLERSPIARDMLAEVRRLGIDIRFDAQFANLQGVYLQHLDIRFGLALGEPELNINVPGDAILLNPRLLDDQLVSILAHELRHALQFNLPDRRGGYMPAPLDSRLMSLRIAEADAQATASLILLELEAAGDGAAGQSLPRSMGFAQILSACRAARPGAQAAEGRWAGWRAAFDAWFGMPELARFYDKHCIAEHVATTRLIATACVEWGQAHRASPDLLKRSAARLQGFCEDPGAAYLAGWCLRPDGFDPLAQSGGFDPAHGLYARATAQWADDLRKAVAFRAALLEDPFGAAGRACATETGAKAVIRVVDARRRPGRDNPGHA